ncbi:transferrin-binding protein-like solute binding protein [Chelativorans salis]|uniref:Transferrin-binding protein-like solute binding protein n=1 Tax=Chelativorans salis TaxID=2978478 RepID=A0ABT2LNM6_9HYPH|nr:transferrin-binding protein-like solute binding protein [Chelativorans sp. EGI FJ00035]MCT7375003.1 transferrin-binding protein-like solute binding protein [Chelativorans sp. EGI FJ00035]
MKKLSFLILPLAVAGCGGGSGGPGGPNGPSFTSFAEMEVSEPTTMEGKGRESTIELTNAGYRLTEPSRVNTSANVEINSDGEPTSISLNTPASNKVINTEGLPPEKSYPFQGGKFQYINSHDNKTSMRYANPEENGFEYQTFGTWMELQSPSTGNVGATSVGAKTRVASIPSSGNATFRGTALGEYVDLDPADNAPEWHTITSEATLNADFAGRSVEFQTTNTTNWAGTPRDELDLNGTMSYSGGSNEMSGTVTTANGMSGEVDGRFYGPGAQEVGGTFSLKGDGVERYYGGYGAKKQ